MVVFNAYSDGVGGVATSASVSAPAGSRAGHLLTAHLYLDSADVSVATSAGWTLIHQAGLSFRIASYARIATGDSADAFRASWSGSLYGHAGMAGFSGVQTSRPIDVVGTDAAGNSRVPSASGVTTTGPNRLLVWCQGADAPATVTVPSGFVQRGGGSGVLVATAVQAAAGPTGSKAGAMSVSQGWVTHMFAIAPTPSGATVAHYDGSAWSDRPLHAYDGGSWPQAAGIGVL